MGLMQLIYVSRPFGFDSATLGGILVAARRNNRRDGVTGALICRDDIYLQLLEGPEAAVGAAFARIVRDDRHLDVATLYSAEAGSRMFPLWAMLDDPARTWLWPPAEVAAGAAIAAGAGVVGVFERLAAEVKATPSASAAS